MILKIEWASEGEVPGGAAGVLEVMRETSVFRHMRDVERLSRMRVDLLSIDRSAR